MTNDDETLRTRDGIATRRMREVHERFDGLRGTSGLVTVDMTGIWCGWLYFGFSGTPSVPNREVAEEFRILHDSENGTRHIVCETAYCSSVLLDLCRDLSEPPTGDASLSVNIFCDAEEHGQYVATLGDATMGVFMFLNDESSICSVTRQDDGSYLQDMRDALLDLRNKIMELDDEAKEDVLESLALFCEKVTEDSNGEIVVEDATAEDVEGTLGLLGHEK